jgi:hypothetical protein
MRAQLAAGVLVLAALGFSPAAAATPAGVIGSPAEVAHADAVAGTLALKAEISIAYPNADCPAGYPPRVFECFAGTGKEIVPGLGSVEESYVYVIENFPPGCTAPPGSDSVRLPASTVRLTVAGKGEIHVRTGGTGCLGRSSLSLSASEPFTISMSFSRGGSVR